MSLFDHCSSNLPRPRVLLRREVELGAVLALTFVLALVATFREDWLDVVDRPLSEALRDVDSWALSLVSYLGGTEVYVPAAVIGAALTWTRCRSLAVTWLVLTPLSIGVNVLLKIAVDRPRPAMPDTGVSLASFPSGHTIHSTIVLGLLVPTIVVLTGRPVSAWIAAPITIALSFGVGLSRVTLGAHWPTDVVAGYVVGLALLIAADLLIRLPPHLEELTPLPVRVPSRSA